MAKAIRGIIATALVLALSLTGLARLGTGVAEGATGWLSGWANRIQLTIDHTKVTGPLSNFPVEIHLSTASGTNSADVSAVFSALGNNSQKIAVTGADGLTQQYVEIEKWDATNEEAYLWTNVPSVSSTTDTVLYLYYDNSQPNNTVYVGPTGSTPAQNVWDSNFVAVWHLAQNGNGTAGEFIDSTRNHHNAQGGSGLGYGTPTLTTSGDGPGVEQSFNGSNQYISVPDADAFSITTTNQLTVSAWMSPSTLDQPTSTGGYTRWLGKATNNNIEWLFEYYDYSYSSRSQWISDYVCSPSGGLGAGDYSTGYVPANGWVYVTGTFMASSPTQGVEYIYRNAAQRTSDESSGDSWQSYGLNYANGTAPLTIGTGWLESGNFWNGRIGEVRVSNIARSTAWIAASYYAESDTLMSYDSPQSGGSGGSITTTPPSVTTNAATTITTSGATLNGSLTGLGTAASVTTGFQYGPTTSYGSTASGVPSSLSAPGVFTATLTGLAAGTTYHYRAVATGSSTSYGADQTFTTTSSSSSSSSSGSSSGSSSTFGLNSGDSVYTSSFLNAQRFQNTVGTGTLTKLEVLVNDTAPSGNLELGVYADNNGTPGNLLLDAGSVPAVNGWIGISGLTLPVTANSYYWLAFVPQNPVGIVYQSTGMPANSHDDYPNAYGSLPTTCTVGELNSTPFVMRATVSDPSTTTTAPSVATTGVTNIGRNSAILNGNLSSLGSYHNVAVSFQYGLTTGYGNTTVGMTLTVPASFSTQITGLASGATYHYRAVATGAGGTTVYGSDETFTTNTHGKP